MPKNKGGGGGGGGAKGGKGKGGGDKAERGAAKEKKGGTAVKVLYHKVYVQPYTESRLRRFRLLRKIIDSDVKKVQLQ